MTLKTCMMTNSTCYREGSPAVPRGIVVHSTGAANPTLKRYVQPSEDDPMRDDILADLGKNKYANDWNHTTRYAGVHAFIGKNEKGEVETYQVLPYDRCAWGVGKGAKGSYNFDPTARLQFEICEDDLADAEYFTAAMREAQEYCAHLCKVFGFDPYRDISSHYESYKAGYAGNHSDPHEWLKKHGRDMDWFRAEVARIMSRADEPKKPPVADKEKPVPAPAEPVCLGDVSAGPPAAAVQSPSVRPGDRVRLRADVRTFKSGKKIAALLRLLPLTVVSVRADDRGFICALALFGRFLPLGEVDAADTESVR